MTLRYKRKSKASVLIASFVFGTATAHSLFQQPNAVGGGTAMMIDSLVFAAAWAVVIELFLMRWRKRRSGKEDEPRT